MPHPQSVGWVTLVSDSDKLGARRIDRRAVTFVGCRSRWLTVLNTASGFADIADGEVGEVVPAGGVAPATSRTRGHSLSRIGWSSRRLLGEQHVCVT